MAKGGQTDFGEEGSFDLRRLRNGDDAEWDRAASYLTPRLMSVAREKLSARDAEEVAQGTLQSLVTKVMKGDSDGNILRFGFHILKFRVIDRLRQLQKERKRFNDSDEGVPDVKGDESWMQPENMLARAEEIALVRDALAKLDPPPDREIVIDRFLHEMKFEDLSAKYDMPIGTIAYKLQRAIQKLKSLLPPRKS